MRSLVLFFTMAVAGLAQYDVQVAWPTTFVRHNDGAGLLLVGDTFHIGQSAVANRYIIYNDGLIGGSFSCNWYLNKLTSYTGFKTVIPWADATLCDNTVGYGGQSFGTAAGTNCSAGNLCTNKAIYPFCMAGHCYTNVFRQQMSTPYAAYDSTLIRSDDLDSSPPHFCNPATVAGLGGGSCPANATTLAGDPPNWATGSGVLFRNLIKFSRLKAVIPADYQDDGVHCPTIAGSNTYAYFLTESGDFSNYYALRTSCANLPSLSAATYETWDGSSWTSTLANAAPVLTDTTSNGSGACGQGYWGQNGAGSSGHITYLPAAQRFVFVGQFYDQCIVVGSLVTKQHLRYATAASLTGPWTLGPGSEVSADLWQYDTNPRGLVVDTGINASSTTLAVNSTPNAGLGVYSPTVFPAVPFVITIGSEKLLVTAATTNSASWTVQRGYNSTTAAAHLAGDAVIAPWRLHPGLVAFVPGTYSVSGGVESIDLAFEGDEYESNSELSQANNVYGLYFTTLRFVRRKSTSRLGQMGNALIQTATLNTSATLPPPVVAYSFDDHMDAYGVGNPYFPLVRPTNYATGNTCTAAQDGGSNTDLQWTTQGLQFNTTSGIAGGNANHATRCQTTETWPITGSAARTITWIFKTLSVTAAQTVWAIQRYNNTANPLGGSASIGSDGSLGVFFDNSNGVKTAAAVLSANTWYLVTLKYTGGSIAAGSSIYINGSYVCGADGSTACTAVGTTSRTPNTYPATMAFGTYGNATNGTGPNCNTADAGPCNYQSAFWGTLRLFWAWAQTFTAAQEVMHCRAWKAQAIKSGVVLTCP